MTQVGNLVYRVPEEAPQEIADLLQRCTGDAEQRPDAHECAEIIAPFVRAGSLRQGSRSLSQEAPAAPAAAATPPARTGSGSGRTGSNGSAAAPASRSGSAPIPEDTVAPL